MTPPAPRRARLTDADRFRGALDEYESAREAWRAAYSAWTHAPEGSLAAVTTLEAARHGLRMAKGRLFLEESWLDNRPHKREKAWGSH